MTALISVLIAMLDTFPENLRLQVEKGLVDFFQGILVCAGANADLSEYVKALRQIIPVAKSVHYHKDLQQANFFLDHLGEYPAALRTRIATISLAIINEIAAFPEGKKRTRKTVELWADWVKLQSEIKSANEATAEPDASVTAPVPVEKQATEVKG